MLATLATLAMLSACRPSAPAVSVHHDSPARTVFLRTGAVDLPAPNPKGDGYHAHATATPLTRFAWPVDGWARGFRLRITDCAGNEVSRNRVHHLVLLHRGRRDLLHPIYQRLMAITQESEDRWCWSI